MAILTRQRTVRTDKWKGSNSMAERRRLPRRCRMALLAMGIKFSRNVIRCFREVEIRFVALLTVGIRDGIISSDVTLLAQCNCVPPRQREFRFAVVEL